MSKDQSSDSSDDSSLMPLIKIGCACLLLLQNNNKDEDSDDETTSQITRQPMHTRELKGHALIFEMLKPDTHPRRVRRLFRMSRDHFMRVVTALKERGLLANTRNITVEEQLAMTILVMSQNTRNEIIQEDFQHSGETVSRHFHNVLNALHIFSREMIQPPSFEDTPDEIKSNKKYYPFFANCIGAIDGTHVSAIVPIDKQGKYRSGRNNLVTQNVCAACSFDMCFTFLWAGWEGTAHDNRILWESRHNPRVKFPHPPPGKYYLVDSGYSHTPGYMAPFRNVRYHQQDFKRRRPEGAEELFNFTHSSMRTVIERSFGVVKKCFPILKMMSSYPFQTQVQIVIAYVTIHNFIRKQMASDWIFELAERGDLDERGDSHNDDNDPDVVDITNVDAITEQQQWEAYRRKIAKQIEDVYRGR